MFSFLSHYRPDHAGSREAAPHSQSEMWDPSIQWFLSCPASLDWPLYALHLVAQWQKEESIEDPLGSFMNLTQMWHLSLLPRNQSHGFTRPQGRWELWLVFLERKQNRVWWPCNEICATSFCCIFTQSWLKDMQLTLRRTKAVSFKVCSEDHWIRTSGVGDGNLHF